MTINGAALLKRYGFMTALCAARDFFC